MKNFLVKSTLAGLGFAFASMVATHAELESEFPTKEPNAISDEPCLNQKNRSGMRQIGMLAPPGSTQHALNPEVARLHVPEVGRVVHRAGRDVRALRVERDLRSRRSAGGAPPDLSLSPHTRPSLCFATVECRAAHHAVHAAAPHDRRRAHPARQRREVLLPEQRLLIRSPAAAGFRSGRTATRPGPGTSPEPGRARFRRRIATFERHDEVRRHLPEQVGGYRRSKRRALPMTTRSERPMACPGKVKGPANAGLFLDLGLHVVDGVGDLHA